MYQNEVAMKARYEDETSCEVSRPVFANVLEDLRREVQMANELAKETSLYCNSLHLMNPAKISDRSPEKQQEPGVANLLFAEIRRLREANNVLHDCVIHLRNVVGN